MDYDAVYPVKLTINRLLKSSRISIESPSREILECARYGVKTAIRLLDFVGRLRDNVGSVTVKALEGEIREATSGMEYVLDSHVSDQFLSQYETERNPLLISLDLQGVEQDIYGYTQRMKMLQKLFNPSSWDKEDETETGLSDQSSGSRTWLIYRFASKAASIFLGMKAEEYIQELDSLLPQEKEKEKEKDQDDDDEEEGDNYAYDNEEGDNSMGPKDFQPLVGDLINDIDWDFGLNAYDNEEGDNYAYDNEEGDNDDIAAYDDDDDDDNIDHNDDDDPYIKYKIMCWWANKAASVIMMEREYIKELDNPLQEEEEEKEEEEEFSENTSNMVGVADKLCEIRDNLVKDSHEFRCTSILGMAGIGKTALAMKILEDPLISSRFERSIFVRIGPEYEIQNIVQDILGQLNPDSDKILVEGDAYLYKIFKERKILIVLDDVWSRDLMSNLRFRLTSDEVWGCCFLVTSRIQRDDYFLKGDEPYVMRFLNGKESWDLFQEKVFAGEACPRELEKAGKKIAENCEGLPLLIVTVAHLLSKVEKTLEYWTEVAASKKNSIFIDAYEKISEVLYPSYAHLYRHLKTCFLYLGAFPQNCEIRISKLTNLWSAEGLGDFNSFSILRQYVRTYFKDLILQNVTLATQHNRLFNSLKACSLHSVFWYLSKREAWNEKFLHILDSHTDASKPDIESRRRLSVYKNAIFGIKDVCQSIESILVVRSLLCPGPYHPYQVPIWFGLRLLKVLDALTIRFYEFPPDVLKLVQLRYLALTCNRNLPPSISNLWGLQCLIVHPHLSIKSSKSVSYLPVEIWHLLELEYLQIMGRNLPDPPPGVVLRKLEVLLDVGAHTCTKRVFKSIPNLDKLRVQIELMPEAAEPLSDISLLKKLSSLQFVIVNPELIIMPQVVSPAPLASASGLTKLTLSGCGYPWKDIQVIAELPNLRLLKLRCYAFRGEEWEVGETEFQSLYCFVIEDTDLVEWTGGSKNFPVLQNLTIENCYKLQKIPQIPSVKHIRIVDCNPSAVTCAKQMAPAAFHLDVYSSWLDSRNFKP